VPGKIIPLRRGEQPPVEEWGGFYPSEMDGPPPPRQWAVDATVPKNTVCLLAGAPKSGKSLLLQQLLTCSVFGIPWIGRHVEKAPALGFFCEDDKLELQRRQWSINEYYGIDAPDLYRDLELNAREGLSTRLVNFDKFSDIPRWSALWDQLWNIVDECGYKLLGFDTATVMMGGENLYSPGKVTVFLRELTQQLAQREASAVVTGHTNRADPTSFAGPTQWMASVRSAMNLSRPIDRVTGRVPDDKKYERQLIDLGGNYAPQYRDVTLRWDRGVLVCDDAEPPPRPTDAVSRAEFDSRVLAGMTRAIHNGVRISALPGEKYSIAWLAKHSTDREFARSAMNDLNDSQDRLLKDGRIVRVGWRGKCLLRLRDGVPYPAEESWLL
jgi:RecA-family ATPase